MVGHCVLAHCVVTHCVVGHCVVAHRVVGHCVVGAQCGVYAMVSNFSNPAPLFGILARACGNFGRGNTVILKCRKWHLRCTYLEMFPGRARPWNLSEAPYCSARGSGNLPFFTSRTLTFHGITQMETL